MTDRVAALAVLADLDGPERADAFDDFAERFKDYPLVIDKWFALQASAIRPMTGAGRRSPEKSLRLHHEKSEPRPLALFRLRHQQPGLLPRRGRRRLSLPRRRHHRTERLNPQIAARLMTPFREWRRYAPAQQDEMKAEMQRIAATPDLSPDVFEIVSKSLAA